MKHSEEELIDVLTPLVYGVSDQDGVVKALVKFILDDRDAAVREAVQGVTGS